MITYQDLLEIFWGSHDPTGISPARQYMAAVFYHDEEQKRQALASRNRLSAVPGKSVTTAILPAGKFYQAEAYHQKYYLQQVPELIWDFKTMYPGMIAFAASAAAARVNGYLGGNGSLEKLQRDIDDFGLSQGGKRKLVQTVRRRLRGG